MNTDDDLTRDLVRAFPVGPGHLSRLHGRLAAAAQAEGLLDVAYCTVDTPIGPLLLAATDLGLVRVAYVSGDHDAVLRALGERISPRILHAPARLDTVVRQIQEYFEGGRRSFDVPLDWRLSNGFRQLVLRHGWTAARHCAPSPPATTSPTASSSPTNPPPPRPAPAVRDLYARRLPDMESRPMIMNSSAIRRVSLRARSPATRTRYRRPLPGATMTISSVSPAPPTGVPARRLHRGRMLAVLLIAARVAQGSAAALMFPRR